MASVRRLSTFRVRSEALKRNPKKASVILTAIGTLPGVRDLEVNLVSGSIFVEYDPLRLFLDDLLEELARNGLDQALRVTPCEESQSAIDQTTNARPRSFRP